MRILIVEDEARLADSVARGLREEGFIVETSGDGEDGLHRLRTEAFDLAILDVMLPRRDGWAVLDALRAERRAIRVLMLTARQSVEDRVRGLEAGAARCCAVQWQRNRFNCATPIWNWITVRAP
jgi:two-component system, OmpR family, copper resistance phosphate regulon response regulator CusR